MSAHEYEGYKQAAERMGYSAADLSDSNPQMAAVLASSAQAFATLALAAATMAAAEQDH